MRQFYSLSLSLIFSICVTHIQAQYAVNGNAVSTSGTPGSTCFRLTKASGFQKGSVWNTTLLDLSQSFELNTQLYFGATDANGADGLAFVLQNYGTTALGEKGGGLGY